MAVVPFRDGILDSTGSVLWMLTVAIFVVLAIACANVGHLLLVTMQARRREFALRAALGARGGRVARLVLIESAVLSLAGGVIGLIVSLWLLRAFFASIPLELEEAAQVDGAGRPRAILHVVAPLALPGVIATGIFTFTLAWNDYIFTRILVATDELKTLPVGVQDLFAAAVVDWGLVMAAGMLITIPALALFLAVQRHLVEGWGSGGLKG